MKIEPFLKWPGGKRWLTRKYPMLFPEHYNRYFEPFLGSGSVFFQLHPKRAILSDANAELINSFIQIRDNYDIIDRELYRLEKRHSKDYYYEMRDTVYSDPLQNAIRFIYLNRTCFNGLYRVNKNGKFNVPIGTKDTVSYPVGYLGTVADALASVVFMVSDYEKVIGKSRKGDFVFVDPPYTVMHNANSFIKYNASLFSWQDQERLAEVTMNAIKRGVMVMITNADHPAIRKMYYLHGKLFSLNRHSVLSGASSHRRATTELVVISYNIIMK